MRAWPRVVAMQAELAALCMPHGNRPVPNFSHPDYDRRLWNLTRSATNRWMFAAHGLGMSKHTLPSVGNYAPPRSL